MPHRDWQKVGVCHAGKLVPQGDVWWLWGAGWDQRTWNSPGGGHDGSRTRGVCAWGDPGCAGCVLGWGGSCGTGWVAVGQGSDRLGTLRVWGGCEQEPPGLTPSARGAGLPGAGVRGAGGGDRVPAGPPGESPHVSRTPRWGWGSHTVPPATRPTWGPPHGPTVHGRRHQHHGVTQSTPRPAPSCPQRPHAGLLSQGGPGEAVRDHPAAGRGAEQLQGERWHFWGTGRGAGLR